MAFTTDTGELNVHADTIEVGKNQLQRFWMMSPGFQVERQGAISLEEGQKLCQGGCMEERFTPRQANTVVDRGIVELLYGLEHLESSDRIGNRLKVAIARPFFNQGMGGNKPCMGTVTIGAAQVTARQTNKNLPTPHIGTFPLNSRENFHQGKGDRRRG